MIDINELVELNGGTFFVLFVSVLLFAWIYFLTHKPKGFADEVILRARSITELKVKLKRVNIVGRKVFISLDERVTKQVSVLIVKYLKAQKKTPWFVAYREDGGGYTVVYSSDPTISVNSTVAPKR